MSQSYKIFIIAGESSGDLHGSYLIKSLKIKNPKIYFNGIGGKMMEKEGLKSLFPINKLSVMGFVEVIKHLPFFIKVKNKVISIISNEQYDHIILIDYPGFNLNLLPNLKKITKAKITYFICPQIWAWKEKRIEILKKYVDNRIVIFPFEQDWYNKRGVNVFFSGHPIMDEWQPKNRDKLVQNLKLNPKSQTLTLYPGSRNQEFSKHFPLFLESASIIRSQIKDLQVVLGCASSIDLTSYKNIIPSWLKVEINNPQYSLEVADIAIIASGTSTLEAAVYGTPGVVVYKLSPISWWLSKLFVKVKFAGMVNLIANKEIMPEYLQKNATVHNISTEILSLLKNKKKYNKKLIQLKKVKDSLGNVGVFNKISNNILN
ncbi:MAG: lipid-A-disaccharide synthase [Candidatus Marinimicrobia bacterium]|nr:lipid-A-disaccharide synthase [Candidatus Neomarinimicrobiota bacterium]|tara:strand:+ start:4298 stop:5419 length:1122 start_codon:yes stop_codon:yes gene_type:complete